jgi:hypothetical protein
MLPEKQAENAEKTVAAVVKTVLCGFVSISCWKIQALPYSLE